MTMLLTVIVLSGMALQTPPAQDPSRVSPDQEPRPAFRELQKDEQQLEGLLQRVECPGNGPVTFVLRVKDRPEKFEAPRLADVEYIAHTPDFKGPMSCGGRGSGDRVLLTWRTAGAARRVVAIEFLPRK